MNNLGIYIPADVIHSPAYKSLTNAARTAIVLLLLMEETQNNEAFTCPYSFAEQYMGRATFASAIRQLEGAGFIKIEQHGGAHRKTNFYRISDSWEDV